MIIIENDSRVYAECIKMGLYVQYISIFSFFSPSSRDVHGRRGGERKEEGVQPSRKPTKDRTKVRYSVRSSLQQKRLPLMTCCTIWWSNEKWECCGYGPDTCIRFRFHQPCPQRLFPWSGLVLSVVSVSLSVCVCVCMCASVCALKRKRPDTEIVRVVVHGGRPGTALHVDYDCFVRYHTSSISVPDKTTRSSHIRLIWGAPSMPCWGAICPVCRGSHRKWIGLVPSVVICN